MSAAPTTNIVQTCVPGDPPIATFDGRAPFPGVSIVNPVGLYRGLRYQSFNIVGAGVALSPNLEVPPVLGLLPQSADIVIVASVVSQTLNGPAAIYAATIPSFVLQELYFGCEVSDGTEVGSVPIPRTVAFTGVKNNLDQGDGERVTVNIPFGPENPVLSHLQRAVFEGKEWSGLNKLEVAIVQSSSTATLTVLYIDNIKYTNCTAAGFR
jgi:hypothetical protein